MALANRLAIIAGGLGGLGSATARMLRAQSCSLALLHHPSETPILAQKLHNAFPESFTYSAASSNHDQNSSQPVPKLPHDISLHPCDITSTTSVSSAIAAVEKSVRSTNTFPSILINAAGHVNITPLEDTMPEDTMEHLTANIYGPLILSQAFVKLFKKFAAERREAVGYIKSAPGSEVETGSVKDPVPPGRIVSISSQASHVALDKHGAYCASKAGLNGLVRSMALEWGPLGITSNTVSPTIAWTYLAQKAWPDPKVRKEFTDQVPMGRFAMPDEVGSAIHWLCQDNAHMVNGADIRVDGGYTIR